MSNAEDLVTGPMTTNHIEEQPMDEPACVYIAEAIWFDDNPADGRNRLAVCASLDHALHTLRTHPVYGDPHLIATEIDASTSVLGTTHARTWAVHQPDEHPDDTDLLWITQEPITHP